MSDPVLEIFYPDMCIQVSMVRTIRGPLRVEDVVLLLIGIIYVAASMREVPFQELKISADAGQIKEPPLLERQTEGILYIHTSTYNFFSCVTVLTIFLF